MMPARFLSLSAVFFALASTACAASIPSVPSATATSTASAPRTIAPTNPPPATPTPPSMALPAPSEPIAPTSKAPVPTQSVSAVPQTVTLSDNRRTITLQLGDRFLLSLGDSRDWALQIDDPAILSRVPNIMTIQGSQGLFEPHQVGQTRLTATGDPPCRKTQPACMQPSLLFQLQIVVTAGSPVTPAPQGRVTYADNGQTIMLRVGDRFLLMLDDIYNWDVSVGDPTIVSRDANIMVAKGQGIYQASNPGDTTLSATGTAICPPQQACPMLALSFKVRIVVQ